MVVLCAEALDPSSFSCFPLPPLQVIIALGDYMDTQCHACIGGTNVRTDLAKLELGQHIVVGTPGRVHDMINRKALGETASPSGQPFVHLPLRGGGGGGGGVAGSY